MICVKFLYEKAEFTVRKKVIPLRVAGYEKGRVSGLSD
jgi:hypothetical protein